MMKFSVVTVVSIFLVVTHVSSSLKIKRIIYSQM